MNQTNRNSDPAQEDRIDRTTSTRAAASWLAVAVSLGILGCFVFKDLPSSPLKITLAVCGALLIALGYLFDRFNWKQAGLAVTALLLALAIAGAYFENHKRVNQLVMRQRISAWNVFHYVLGTKYFDQTGYFDLYNTALLADQDGDKFFASVPLTRNMHTYRDLPRLQALKMAEEDGIRGRFTDQRWSEFKKDLAAIQSHRSAKGWQGTLRDLGYNPSPAWLIVHRPLLNYLDISKETTLKWLCSLDLVFYALTFLVLVWALGLRIAAASALWACLYFGNEDLMIGGYLHYDWLLFTVLAVGLYRKGHPLASAPVLAYVAMIRGFPGLLAVGPAVCWLRETITTRKLPRKLTVFLVALGFCCLAMIALGSTTARGPGAWMEWQQKISIHSKNHPLFAKRSGLGSLFARDYQKDRWSMSIEARRTVLKRNRPAWGFAKWTLVGLTLLAMIRRRDENAMLLGFAIIFATLVISRYYATVWVLMLAWMPLDRRKIGNLLISVYLFLLIAAFYWYDALPGINAWRSYYYFNAAMLLFFIAVIANFLAQDVVALVKRFRKPQPLTTEF